MKEFTVKNSINPKDWVIPGTNTFIMPVLVTVSSNPDRNYIYNIRHGKYSREDGGKLTDFIEDGTDFCGGFQTMQQVIDFSLNEAEILEGIYKYVKLALPEKAYEIWIKSNPGKKYSEHMFNEFTEKKWEEISIAWRAFHKALIKGVEDGYFTNKFENIARMNIGMQ